MSVFNRAPFQRVPWAATAAARVRVKRRLRRLGVTVPTLVTTRDLLTLALRSRSENDRSQTENVVGGSEGRTA